MTVFSTFQDLDFDGSLAGAKIMVAKKNYPIIGDQVAVNCVAL